MNQVQIPANCLSVISRPLRRSGAPILVALAALAACAGCSKKEARTVGVAAAHSVDAQRELRRLEERWELGSDVARGALRKELEEFLERFPTDPSGARARVMLAQIALAERRYGSVESLLSPLISGPSGRFRDEAQVILAAVENRRGDPERALELLSPLRGKLLTREARDQYARERTMAAMSARKWRLSVSAMLDWLESTGQKSAETREWIESAVSDVPTSALARQLADWSAKKNEKQSAARSWMHRLIVLHVTREALKKRDPLLARDLLLWSPPWLRASEQGDELSLLAALAAQDAQVTGRALGMVLGGHDEITRRRSVRVAAGVLRGLNEGEGEKVKFLAAEDRGSLEVALGTLSGLGATVLVAGLDEAGASVALSYAAKRKVPVVTMSAPDSTARMSEFGFVFGVSVAQQRDAMKAGSPSQTWAFVGLEEVGCDRPMERALAARLPADSWRAKGVSRVGVLGDVSCLSWVNQALAGLDWSPLLVSGLEAGHAAASRGIRALAAGRFPQGAEAPTDKVTAREEAVMHGKKFAAELPRDWYFLLGYDAARLIRPALLGLPKNNVTEAAEVKERHRLAGVALSRASADLVTAKARGFSGSVLKRSFRVTEKTP